MKSDRQRKRNKGVASAAVNAGSPKRAPAGGAAALSAGGPRGWHLAAGAAFALLIVFAMYWPAVQGPFLFDDKYLPFTHPEYKELPLERWLIGVRPTLMLSFWLNYQLSGENPLSYHVLNVLLHFLNGLWVFLIVRRILDWAGTDRPRREILAAFAGCAFLFHPIQSEAVAYVASRSENLSVFFFYAALTVFVYRRSEAIGFVSTLLVLALFGAAVTTKEHTAVLPFLLALTDYFFNPGFSWQGLRRNWRLYVPVAAAGAAGFAFILSKLAESDTAGFRVEGLPWYLYFVTQCKVIWIYLRMFLLPLGQNVDHDYPMAASAADPLGLLGMAALAALMAAAWIHRRRWPVFSYGVLAFLLLLAPTSSFIPIKDALVERRLYLPMVGLLLVAAGLLRRWRVKPPVLAAALGVVLAAWTLSGFERGRVWAGPIPLWQDAVAKTPENWRANFQLAYAYFDRQMCSESVAQYEKTAALREPDYRLLVDWALACDCAGRPEEALVKLKQAAGLEQTAHVHAMIGMMYGKQSKYAEALAALETAEKFDNRFMMTYFYRGNVHASMGNHAAAARAYRRALEIEPGFAPAERALQRSEQFAGAR